MLLPLRVSQLDCVYFPIALLLIIPAMIIEQTSNIDLFIYRLIYELLNLLV